MVPKGQILVIGGAEDKGDGQRPDSKDDNKEFEGFEILGSLLPKEKKEKHTIEVITAASEIPVEVGRDYTKAFNRMGFNNVQHMQIQNRQDANKEEYIDRIERAHAVLFSGGDQFRLSTIMGSTKVT